MVLLDRTPMRKIRSHFIYKLRSGVHLMVRTDDVDGRIVDNTFLGEYYAPGFEINPADTVIDIGAHIGSFTLYALSKIKNGKVYAFEPFSQNFKLLQANILLNRYKNIHLYRLAVYNMKIRQKLYLSPGSRSLASLTKTSTTSELVKSVTLSDIFHKHRIAHCHFLKLDCEGSEYKILTSIPGNILKRIDAIVFESHLEKKYYFKLKKYLEQHHFTHMHTRKHNSELSIQFFKKKV